VYHDNPNQSALLIGRETLLDVYIVQELAARNIPVTVLVRKLEHAQKFKTKTSTLKEGTITPRIAPKYILAGTQSVISTLGMPRKRKTPFDIGMDYRTNLELLEDAQKAGVKKLIYVTDTLSSQHEKWELVSERNNFIRHLTASGMEYTILQVDGLFSDYIDYLDKADKGKAILVTNDRLQFNPIHPKDLASACVDAFETDENVIIVRGPENLNRNKVMDMAFKAHGKKLKTVHLPKGIDRFFQWLRQRFRSSKKSSFGNIPVRTAAKNEPAPKYGRRPLAVFFENKVDAFKRFSEDR